MSDSSHQQSALNVVIYWHMHQPEYRDLRNGEYHLPWTYLHTIKDYVDMAAHLENTQGAKAVVNFAPVLLEQIDDYAKQLNGFLQKGQALRDPLLSALATPVLLLDKERRIVIIKSCLKANKQHLIERFEAFKTLAELAENILNNVNIISYYSEQFFVDLLVWYHLAWIGETVRKTDLRIQTLMKKSKNFSVHDRHVLVSVIYELISGVIGRYKKLVISGKIELTMTPYAHPIMPLLLDIKSADQAMPNVELPDATEYPGGASRCHWHMKKGLEVFKKYFGFEPQGCWPSEGSISADTIELISQSGIKWLASGETVLQNSINKSSVSLDGSKHIAYQYRDNQATCFFRNDGLSDLIGFKYSDWHGDDAVANLVENLQNIAAECADDPDAIVSIILDGENAWEYYHENGYYFISSMYEKISQNKKLKLTTFSEYLEKPRKRQVLNEIVAGSWVYGTFSTWIGERDKNRAWDMLVDAKKIYDRVMHQNNLTEDDIARINLQMATCESSDWFWWFGEVNSSETVATFDEQFRLHLANLYQMLNVEPPDYLTKAFSFGSGENTMSGTMLPGKQV